MAWETFKRRMKPSPKEPTVTLSKSGLIGLNAAVARNLIGEHLFAHLLFDRDRHLLGIKFIKHNDPDAYPVKVTKSRSHGAITGVSFMKAYKIYPTQTTSYPATYDERDKMLVVDLSNAVGVRSKKEGARRRKQIAGE